MAAEEGHDDVVRILLSKNADPNIGDRVSIINNEVYTDSLLHVLFT